MTNGGADVSLKRLLKQLKESLKAGRSEEALIHLGEQLKHFPECAPLLLFRASTIMTKTILSEEELKTVETDLLNCLKLGPCVTQTPPLLAKFYSYLLLR